MADEELTTTGVESAGGDTPVTQDAGSTSQEAGQGQSTPQGSQVDNPGQNASSEGKQGRPKSNGTWAQERLIEKAIKRNLDSILEAKLNPLLERLNPPAPRTNANDSPVGEPDYNNFNAWMQKAVEAYVKRNLETALPEKLGEFEGRLKTVSKTQEARNYLLSQEDIGSDEEKLSEIEQVIKDEMLDYALEKQPLKVVQKAVKIWRERHKNPNAPTKQMLGTVSGGTGSTTGKKELGVQDLIALQRQLAQGGTVEEMDKLYAQIESLMK